EVCDRGVQTQKRRVGHKSVDSILGLEHFPQRWLDIQQECPDCSFPCHGDNTRI
ncbi:hypothetical protein J6590_086823, partial [Homalodisca vitripennis]